VTVQHLPNSTTVIGRVFPELADQWRAETDHLSDNEKVAAHPNYRALVALGPRVVPFMLRELKSKNPPRWFQALEEITGENPILPEQRGKMLEMAAAWLKWGEQHGYSA
jgi:hypothetical protein